MTPDDFLLHQLLMGMRDRALRTKILAKKGIKLAPVMEYGKAWELANRQWKDLPGMATETVAAVGAKSSVHMGGRPKQHGGSGGGKDRYRDRENRDYDCKKCGTRHKFRNCPAYDKTCKG